MRLLTALAAIGQGTYTLTGTPRMQERPLQELLDGLEQIGIRAWSVNRTGCPPVKVEGAPVPGGTVVLDCRKSSQYLSALLLIAPYTRDGLEIQVAHGPSVKTLRRHDPVGHAAVGNRCPAGRVPVV